MCERQHDQPVCPQSLYPQVVACLATRNAAAFIADTLSTLAEQTYPRLQVLISDDASTDGTLAICTRFATADPRFQVVQQPQQLGWLGNINALLQLAQGDYLFFMPHDDRLVPTYVTRLVEALEHHPAAILAFSDIEFISVTGVRELQTYTDLDGVKHPVSRGYRVLRQRGYWWLPYRGIFRATTVSKFGRLRHNLAGERSADWHWLLHMALIGEFIRVPEVLYYRIQRIQSLSRIWRYTTWAWIAAALACGVEVQRSHLSPLDKMMLHILVIATCFRWLLHGIQSYVFRDFRHPTSKT